MYKFTTNKQEAQNLATFARTIENWYKTDGASDTWPLNEIAYATAGILKECAQGLEGGNFDPQYIIEKMATIRRSAHQAVEAVEA